MSRNGAKRARNDSSAGCSGPEGVDPVDEAVNAILMWFGWSSERRAAWFAKTEETAIPKRGRYVAY